MGNINVAVVQIYTVLYSSGGVVLAAIVIMYLSRFSQSKNISKGDRSSLDLPNRHRESSRRWKVVDCQIALITPPPTTAMVHGL